ncbi:MAG: hypothetical protein HY876_10945 [Coriobacteriales bacterium]|nr:hypothetical protein [Coriobacteriales bacterium]
MFRYFLLEVVVAGAAIALTSNFMNLMDLRPGRALKLYMPFWLIGVLLTGSLTTPVMGGYAPIGEFAPTDVVSRAVLAIFSLGPVIAVWRYDLGERGMLGDAGANPMGAVAGLLIVTGLPLWGLVAYFVLMLALNLLSERVSFSRVIEATPPLRWLDRLGRLPEDEPGESSEASAGNTRVTGEG